MIDDLEFLLDAIAVVESNNNPTAVSKKGALGAYQIMPATYKEEAAELHIMPEEMDPFNPEQSRRVAKHYLEKLDAYFKDLKLDLAAYNWGRGNVSKALALHKAHTWPEIERYAPEETKNYVRKVEAAFLRRTEITPYARLKQLFLDALRSRLRSGVSIVIWDPIWKLQKLIARIKW